MRTSAVVFLFLLAIGSPLSAQDPFEPDNNQKSARPIPFNKTETRTLPKGDWDWYKLDVPSTGIVRARIEGWNKEAFKQATPYIKYYTPGGRQIREWRHDVMYVKGELYVSIAEHWDDGQVQGSDDPYKVTFTFEPETDRSEPNNTRDSARPLKFGEVAEARLVPWDDGDYFRLDAPATGIVRMQLDDWNAEAFKKKVPYVRFFQAGDSAIREWRHDAQVVQGPVYCLIQEHWYDDKVVGADAPFKVSFTFEPETDASEPNNGMKTARAVAFDQTITARLVPWKDVDYFKLDVPAVGIVRMKIDHWNAEAYKRPYPYVRVFNADGKTIREWRHDVQAVQGSLYVAVSEHWDDSKVSGANAPFQLTFSFEPEVDDSEPNNSRETARTVKFNETITARLVPWKDVDVYRLDLPSPGMVQLQIDEWNAAAFKKQTPRIRFAGADGKIIREGHNDVIAPAGPLYVFIDEHWDGDKIVGADAPFKLTFTFEQVGDTSEPNNSIAEARPVKLDEPIAMQLTPRMDVDYLKIDVPKPGIITWRVEGWDAKATGLSQPYVLYVDKDGNHFVNESPDVRAAGAQYASVKEHWDSSRVKGVDETFHITFTRVDDPDPDEPANDRIDGAKTIEIGKPFTTIIAPSYDGDVVTFTAPRAMRLRLDQVDGPDGPRPFVWLLTSEGERVHARNVGEHLDVAAGSQWVSVHMAAHPGGVIDPVTLQLTAVDAPPMAAEEKTDAPANVQRWTFNVERTE